MKILIPVGDYPGLKKANIANIEETAGIDVDIHFLTGEQKHGVHLDLLDKAFYEMNDDWLFIQHSDLFWRGNGGWMKQVEKAIKSNPNIIALAFSKKNYIGSFDYREYKYYIDEQPVIRTHDFIGCYNRKRFVENEMTFRWGSFKELPRSLLLQKQNIWYYNRILCDTDFLDGSDLIGLELALKPGSIGELELLGCKFNHAWGIFANVPYISYKGTELHILRPYDKCCRGLLTFAWMTTYLEGMGDLIVPYAVIKQIMPGEPNSIVYNIEKYIPKARKTLPKVTKVIFLDRSFNIISYS